MRALDVDLRRASSSRCARRPAAGRAEYAQAFMQPRRPSNPTLAAMAPYVLYETLGPTLRTGRAGGAPALWGLAHRCAMTYPDAVRRAGHADGEELFDAILAGRSGITFTVDEYDDAWTLRRSSGQADRARDSRAARGARGARAGPDALHDGCSCRSCSRPASGARTRPTRSSATRRGASATPKRASG